MTSPPSPPPPFVAPLHLTIRFSTSLPDVDLDIASPEATTVLSLKHLLRTRLATRNRLRLIHQGRLLPDPSALTAVLKPPPPPAPPHPKQPPSSPRPDPKGKGKAIDRPPRLYVNCSIGDELSAADLAAERAAAGKPPDAASSAAASSAEQLRAPVSTRPRPTGFDRLLQAGFSASEIATLRSQFASIHAERFAPDAPPSPDTMRGLEDAWIDSNAGGVPAAGGAGGGGGAAEAGAGLLDDDVSGMATVLDVLVRGMMVGFFFPLGSMTWLLRQGIWSDKWQIFVGSGVVLSVTVGVIMGISRND